MSWIQDDRRAVLAPLASWSPAAWGGDWLGIYGPNESPGRDLTAQGDDSRPSGFLTWSIDYTGQPQGFLDGDANPIRRGFVVLALHVQLGAGEGVSAPLWEELQGRYDGADTGAMTFFADEALPQAVGVKGEWHIESLGIPFVGT
ncbi:MAG: hypothetical protein AAF604_04565 [Acidobacteriota bacterium]